MASRFSEVGRGAATIACLGLAAVLRAQQPTRAQTEALARQAAERLQSLQREADQLAAQEQTLLGDLRKSEIERQMKAEEVRRLDAEIRQVTSDLADATARARTLEAQDLAQRPGLRARIVETYKLGQARYLRLLLSTADVQRAADAARTVSALADLDRKRVAEHQRTLAELKTTRSDLESRRGDLEKLRLDAQRAQSAAERAAQIRLDLIQDIDRRRDLNAQLAGELQGAQAKLQMTLRDLASGAPAATPTTLPFGPFRGDLPWPIDGAVRVPFGRGTAERGGRSNGMEISAGEGAAVRVVHEGTVAFAGPFTGFGNLIIVDHGSKAFSLYGNLLEIQVSRGARVERGQSVGTVGPSPTGPPGLYFEMRVDGQPVDPLQWLKKR